MFTWINESWSANIAIQVEQSIVNHNIILFDKKMSQNEIVCIFSCLQSFSNLEIANARRYFALNNALLLWVQYFNEGRRT